MVGTVLYVRGAIVPLVFGSVPFFTRQVESALAELDGGLIEAALSMGSSPLEIIFRVYLKESIAAIARGTTITIVSLLNPHGHGRRRRRGRPRRLRHPLRP
ncbi:MAG: ABC transporter permease subunit [Oscillibacter sp.]